MNLIFLRERFANDMGCQTLLFSLLILQTRKDDVPDDKDKDSIPSTKEILHAKGVLMVLIIFVFTLSMAMAYTALLPVFIFTEVTLGGFGLSPEEIAYLLGGGGAGQALITFAYPFIHKRFGSKGIISGASYAWPLLFMALPAMNLALRHGLPVNPFWICSGAFMMSGSAISMSFTSVQLAINDISPSPNAIGSLNGIGAECFPVPLVRD